MKLFLHHPPVSSLSRLIKVCKYVKGASWRLQMSQRKIAQSFKVDIPISIGIVANGDRSNSGNNLSSNSKMSTTCLFSKTNILTKTLKSALEVLNKASSIQSAARLY